VIRENGQRRKITKFEVALKQLANKAAAGDPRAIRDVLKLQPLLGQPEHANDEKIIVNIVRFADQGPTASGRE
jgi:hypothetical protein